MKEAINSLANAGKTAGKALGGVIVNSSNKLAEKAGSCSTEKLGIITAVILAALGFAAGRASNKKKEK